MLTERLTARCPSAAKVGLAQAEGFGVSFAKRGGDGSGKAMLEETAGAAHGVVFEIDAADRAALDRCEFGYRRDDGFKLTLEDGGALTASTYFAAPDTVDRQLKPYDWYHGLVLAGARQHGLPRPHLDTLSAFAVLADPQADRRSRTEALAILRGAGF